MVLEDWDNIYEDCSGREGRGYGFCGVGEVYFVLYLFFCKLFFLDLFL